MPDGSPIDQWWKSHRPANVSTTNSARVCMVSVLDRKTACGRKPTRDHQTAKRDDVTCADCRAAMRADTQ